MSAQRPRVLRSYISPNYTQRKLEPPFYRDLVDVFDDRFTNWLIAPAKNLLSTRHGEIPAVGIALTYFESIESYYRGESSDRKSKEFFSSGLSRVFLSPTSNKLSMIAIGEALYSSARCGFAHSAFAKYNIFFSDSHPHPIVVTWTKINGEFDPAGRMTSAIINSKMLIDGIELHFDRYIKDLRRGDPELKTAFLKQVDLSWGLNKPTPFVAMTQEDFLGNL